MKKVYSVILMISILMTLAACSGGNGAAKETNVLDKTDIVAADKLKASGTSKEVGYQLDKPEKGEEIAVITTNMGTIKMRFFPEVAPKAVYNFKKHAMDGYYNGIIFHRIIPDFMIQTGDPQGEGFGGESVWGTPFEDEFSDKVFNITGSVSMANSGENTNGSQIFINNTTRKNNWQELETVYNDYYKGNEEQFHAQYGGTVDVTKLNDKIKKLYDDNGGNINLDGSLSTMKKGHTVFAQVFEGMDVVDKISKVETGEGDKPVTEVVMEKVEVMIYE